MKKQWGKFMADILIDIDALRRISQELEHYIRQTSDDPYALIRIKTMVDETIWRQEQELKDFNNYVEGQENALN